MYPAKSATPRGEFYKNYLIALNIKSEDEDLYSIVVHCPNAEIIHLGFAVGERSSLQVAKAHINGRLAQTETHKLEEALALLVDADRRVQLLEQNIEIERAQAALLSAQVQRLAAQNLFQSKVARRVILVTLAGAALAIETGHTNQAILALATGIAIGAGIVQGAAVKKTLCSERKIVQNC